MPKVSRKRKRTESKGDKETVPEPLPAKRSSDEPVPKKVNGFFYPLQVSVHRRSLPDKMDKQAKGSGLCFKRDQSQRSTFDGRHKKTHAAPQTRAQTRKDEDLKYH